VPARSDELAPDAAKTLAKTGELLRQNELQGALECIWGLVSRANQYVDQTAPFKLAKDPAQSKRLDEVLYNLAETCRVLAVLLWPFLPGTSERIYAQLGLKELPINCPQPLGERCPQVTLLVNQLRCFLAKIWKATQRGKAERGKAQRGKAQRGKAQRAKAQRGKAQSAKLKAQRSKAGCN
jgi:methionyl-tRNA synthetase